ncbi:MAG: hypothetical protein GF355_03180 [Candidatus Eisenbacteria bacterium]|nr:hypothetical protein [Candidatus Latescibacterota bacterium]MBD3334496.1 hypothetical protein [Candidatus Eisenbacteria bacterium]
MTEEVSCSETGGVEDQSPEDTKSSELDRRGFLLRGLEHFAVVSATLVGARFLNPRAAFAQNCGDALPSPPYPPGSHAVDSTCDPVNQLDSNCGNKKVDGEYDRDQSCVLPGIGGGTEVADESCARDRSVGQQHGVYSDGHCGGSLPDGAATKDQDGSCGLQNGYGVPTPYDMADGSCGQVIDTPGGQNIYDPDDICTLWFEPGYVDESCGLPTQVLPGGLARDPDESCGSAADPVDQNCGYTQPNLHTDPVGPAI